MDCSFVHADIQVYQGHGSFFRCTSQSKPHVPMISSGIWTVSVIQARWAELLVLAETAWGWQRPWGCFSLIPSEKIQTSLRHWARQSTGPLGRAAALRPYQSNLSIPSCLWKEGWESRATHSGRRSAPMCQTEQELWTATGKRNSPFNVL